MKNLIVVLIWSIACPIAAAQDLYTPKAEKVLFGNNRPQNIVAGGISNLFASFTPTPGVTYQPHLDGMFLCLGGRDSLGNVVTAIKSYGTSGADFYAGPNLPIPDNSLLKNSRDYDKIWKMTAVEITTFQEDLKDSLLNGAFPNIMSWPARNNPYSETFNGFSLPENVDLAPFKDLDKDGIYDPKKGDFPMLEGISETNLPAVFYWCVYHDRGVHTFSKGKPINVEVQQSAWLYDCKSDTILSNSMFFSYKIINKGRTAIDSLKAGLFTDPDFYCNKNNMTGCIPDQNTFWMYQNSGYNENCNITYSRYIKPAISFTFLNQPMAAFVATGFDGFNSLPQNILPHQSIGYYNLLQGKWATGDKITCCGVGYEKNTTQAATTFLFPENPNNIGAWSMQQNQNSIPSTERAAIGSVNLKTLLPNQSQRIDIAISYHQDTSYRKVLQATDLMYRNIPILQSAYNQKVALKNCFTIDTCSGEECVYPGDLNHDGIANMYDQVDYYTFPQNINGKTRNGTKYWIPQQAKNWDSTQLNGNDLKHCDADGNGQIGYTDYLAIIDNYGNQTPFYERPKDVFSEGKDFFFNKLSQNLDTLNFVFFNPSYQLQLSKENTTNFRVAAFQIEYDTRVFEPMKFNPAPIAETKIGNMQEVDFYNNLNSTKITTVTFKTNDDYIVANKLPSACTSIRIKNIKAVRKDGTLNSDLGSKDYVICFDKKYVVTQDVKENLNISIFPNPFENQLIIENNNTQHIDYQILNMQGQLLEKGNILAENRQTIDTYFLPKGIYFIELKGENGARKVEKIVK